MDESSILPKQARYQLRYTRIWNCFICGLSCGLGRFLTSGISKIIPASGSVPAGCGLRLFPSWMRPARSQRDMISNHYSTRGGDLSVPCLSYFTKLQSNVKPSLRGRSWSPIVQLQRQTRRYTLPEDNSKDSLPVRTPWLRTKQMPPHRSTFSPPNLHNDEPYEPPA